jgi:hypothetical protein
VGHEVVTLVDVVHDLLDVSFKFLLALLYLSYVGDLVDLGFLLVSPQELSEGGGLSLGLGEGYLEEFVVSHLLFDLVLEELMVVDGHLALLLQLLHFSLLTLQNLVQHHSFVFEPLDLTLQACNLGIVAQLSCLLLRLVLEELELLLYFGHVASVGSQEVVFVILEHLLELGLDVVDAVLQ